MSNAEEARRLVARAHTRPRSPLSTIPIIKVGDEYHAGALPIAWKNDLEPMTRMVAPPQDDGPPAWPDGDSKPKRVRKKPAILTALAYVAELEASIEKAGGIENVMVLDDGVDPRKEMDRVYQRTETERLRKFYREVLGWDV